MISPDALLKDSELLVIAQPTDRVATLFVQECKTRNLTATLLDIKQAGHVFTIECNEHGVQVAPQIPVVLRPPAPRIVSMDVDEVFHYNECFSTVWAAALLSSSAVVGRPSMHGIGGRCTSSAYLTESLANLDYQRPEIFSTKRPTINHGGIEDWYFECQSSSSTDFWQNYKNQPGPFRSRPVLPDEGYEIVIVLEARSWRLTNSDLSHFGMEEASVSACQALQLNFAAVVWAVRPNLSEARVTRIDPWPSWGQLEPIWPSIAQALVEFLKL